MIFYVVSQVVVLHSCASVQQQMLFKYYPGPLLSDSRLGRVQILRSHSSFLSNHDSGNSKVSCWIVFIFLIIIIFSFNFYFIYLHWRDKLIQAFLHFSSPTTQRRQQCCDQLTHQPRGEILKHPLMALGTKPTSVLYESEIKHMERVTLTYRPGHLQKATLSSQRFGS